jgi:hypothetical protein
MHPGESVVRAFMLKFENHFELLIACGSDNLSDQGMDNMQFVIQLV